MLRLDWSFANVYNQVPLDGKHQARVLPCNLPVSILVLVPSFLPASFPLFALLSANERSPTYWCKYPSTGPGYEGMKMKMKDITLCPAPHHIKKKVTFPKA